MGQLNTLKFNLRKILANNLSWTPPRFSPKDFLCIKVSDIGELPWNTTATDW